MEKQGLRDRERPGRQKEREGERERERERQTERDRQLERAPLRRKYLLVLVNSFIVITPRLCRRAQTVLQTCSTLFPFYMHLSSIPQACMNPKQK